MATTEDLEEYSFLLAEDPAEKFSESEQHIAVPIMFLIGIFGLTANISAFRIIFKSKSLRNCFGYLLLLHCSANILLLGCFVFWASPITIFDNSLADSTLGFKVGQLAMTCYYTILYAQLAKAFNRFFAIYSPVKYRKWFFNGNMKFVITAVIILGLVHGALYFLPGCNFYYDGVYVAWDYEYNPCYDIMSFYVDLIVFCSVMGLVILVDSSTLCLIIKQGLMWKRANNDVKFFVQTFSTSILYVVMAISDQFLSYLNINRWYVFVTSTLAWECCHVIDGVLMVVFSFRKKKIQPVSVSPLIVDTHNKSIIRIT